MRKYTSQRTKVEEFQGSNPAAIIRFLNPRKGLPNPLICRFLDDTYSFQVWQVNKVADLGEI